MPKVGSKSYSYDAKGMAAAKQEAARTGQPMKVHTPSPKSTDHPNPHPGSLKHKSGGK